MPAWSQSAQLVLEGKKKKTGRENKSFGFSFDQTIIREKKIGIWLTLPQDTHTPRYHAHTHIRSFVAPANPVGWPLILRHIYNLCNDNLIPPAGRGKHTPLFMLLMPPVAQTCTCQRQQLRLSPSLPDSPGLRSANWYFHYFGEEQD